MQQTHDKTYEKQNVRNRMKHLQKHKKHIQNTCKTRAKKHKNNICNAYTIV